MTKEELEQEAKEYLLKHTTYDETFDMNFINVTTLQAYIAGAEPREKQIAKLEAQIEEMKCCENCRYRGQINNCTYEYYSRCAYECKDYSLWEFKEWQ